MLVDPWIGEDGKKMELKDMIAITKEEREDFENKPALNY